MNNFNITLIIPPDEPHAMAFVEAAQMLRNGLEKMGEAAEITVNRLDPYRFTIIFGGIFLPSSALNSIEKRSAIFNLEQLTARGKSKLLDKTYFDLLSKVPVIDYNPNNIAFIRQELGNLNTVCLPPFFTDCFAQIKPQEENIDVLFFGCLNERRSKIIDTLKSQGLNVVSLFGVYGQERDAYIARSKLVLNLHFYIPAIFEEVRVSHLLANKKAVVAEVGNDTIVENDMREAVAGVPYDQLVATCIRLLNNDAERQTLAERGHHIFKMRDPAAALADIQRWAHNSATSAPQALPVHLNLGSGRDWRDDHLNIDIAALSQPDIIVDIASPQLFEQAYRSKRLGTVTLMRGMFQTITANDVLEHIPDLSTAMKNCLDLLQEGGTFHIQVPYDLSHGAWQDPTHIRAFNEKSWLYYTDWFWYLSWSEYRFELVNQGFALSELGTALKAQGRPLDELIRTPRAVDALRIVLRKKVLSTEERNQALTANSTWLYNINRPSPN